MLLIYILIFIFIILMAYQIYLANRTYKIVEGLENEDTSTNETKEYKPYNLSDPNNSLILAQQNAGNIQVLKGRIDDLHGVKEKVDNIQQSIDLMQTQIDGLVQQQADYAQQIAGSTPPTITGTDTLTTTDVENAIEEEDK